MSVRHTHKTNKNISKIESDSMSKNLKLLNKRESSSSDSEIPNKQAKMAAQKTSISKLYELCTKKVNIPKFTCISKILAIII